MVDSKAGYVTILRAKLLEGFFVRRIVGIFTDNFAVEGCSFDTLPRLFNQEKGSNGRS